MDASSYHGLDLGCIGGVVDAKPDAVAEFALHRRSAAAAVKLTEMLRETLCHV
jgi:hypothetical protein